VRWSKFRHCVPSGMVQMRLLIAVKWSRVGSLGLLGQQSGITGPSPGSAARCSPSASLLSVATLQTSVLYPRRRPASIRPPGPGITRGRGAPEGDIFEVKWDKDSHVTSQGARFSHDYAHGEPMSIERLRCHPVHDTWSTGRSQRWMHFVDGG